MSISERVKVYSVEVGALWKAFVRINKVRNNLTVLKQLIGFRIRIQRSQIFLDPVVVLLWGWREVDVVLRQAIATVVWTMQPLRGSAATCTCVKHKRSQTAVS